MDKPLIDKDKKDIATEPEATASMAPAKDQAAPVSAASPQEPASAPSPGHETDQSVGAYGPQATRPLITKEAWKEIDPHKAWMEDPKTRLGIRMFSRGILGAAFFTAGGSLATKWMRGDKGVPMYNFTKGLSEQKNPLQFIAKLIDTVVGKPIEAGVAAIAGEQAGMRAVRFRPTRYLGGGTQAASMRGRSLGDEAVSITFDFFCASLGDALGRDIAGWFDPNVKKTWTDDKGNIQIPKAIDSALRSIGRYVTYNGGEDWAVAIPYAYFMKGQRALINRASPGFHYDFDRAVNGGSFKLSGNKPIGNYNLEGIIDLQTRFTAYNIGTLMYREAYDYVTNKIDGKPDSLYGAQDKEEPKGLLDKAGNLVKWAARSAIKGAVIMTPSVPFFWITRTPQTKHKGYFIDPEKGILSSPGDNKGFAADNRVLAANLPLEYREYRMHAKPYEKGQYDNLFPNGNTMVNEFQPSFTERSVNGRNKTNFDAYAKTFGIVDKGLNAVGQANYRAASVLDGRAAWADKNFGAYGNSFKKNLGIDKFQNFTRPMIYASASYTPYMYAKAEFANLWDNGKMDMAAERLIDGATSFNWGEFKAGAGEVLNSILHKPLDDPEREAEGHRRDAIDTSPADIFYKTQAKANEEARQGRLEAERKKQNLSWQERVISAKAPEEKHAKSSQEPSASPKKHADQEAMRKALEELKPPTNAIN